ncbi:MAG: flavoprotein [Planctomycetota bacterium]
MNRSRILLGVGGGIAAYKAADLCSKLAQADYDVQVVMTASALEFIGASTFAALSGRTPATKRFDEQFPLGSHIELARDRDAFVIAPATANLLSKLAHGTADDLLSTTYLQCTAPTLIAPAMSDAMWRQPSVQRNVTTLKQDGCHLIGPEKGWLSCRKEGMGRMSDPATIVSRVQTIIDSIPAKS